jgi:hypothetical protein
MDLKAAESVAIVMPATKMPVTSGLEAPQSGRKGRYSFTTGFSLSPYTVANRAKVRSHSYGVLRLSACSNILVPCLCSSLLNQRLSRDEVGDIPVARERGGLL